MNDVPRNFNRATTPVVVTNDTVPTEGLATMTSGSTIAIRVPSFFSVDLCDQFADAILGHEKMEHYAVAPDIKKIGKAVFDAASDPSALDEYYRTAISALREMRQFFHPYLAPMDKLRLALQEAWLAGSTMENLHGKSMFCGLVRVFKEGSEARPHQDMAHWDVPDSLAAKTLITQFAANIHLKNCDEGGEVELWPYGLRDEIVYNSTKTPGDYGLDREKIGPSAVKLKPSKGELIIFDAQKVHAVNRINRGDRIAVSCFIGYRGPAAPLTVFS